ncbi:MAG: ferritin-like domain-containing protein [Deltaproteobacteria bacterium]|nr:ferritin-like domain-containing protein [Deltaproteobacteria bacterium]
MEKVPLSEFYMVYGPQALADPSTPEISAVEQLMNEFEYHEDQEGEFIKQYKEIAERSKNPLVKFLLDLIISDEEKHRAAIHAIVSTLEGDLTWTKQEDALQGFGELDEEKENKELLKVTADFIKHEKEGIKDYKKLMKSSKGYYYGVFVLLLQSIIRDSEKHVEILEFLRRRLREG